MSAIELLEKAAGHLKDRAETYDKPDGERSIGATVAAFNAVTGDGLMNSEERGWLFMSILKMVRSQQGNYKADNYEDLAAYGALMGEAACEERNGGWAPEAIESAAFKAVVENVGVFNKSKPCEYTLDEVVGDAVLSDWARWVAVDEGGGVFEYSREVFAEKTVLGVMWKRDGWKRDREKSNQQEFCFRRINTVVPPLNFKNCIWEVNK